MDHLDRTFFFRWANLKGKMDSSIVTFAKESVLVAKYFESNINLFVLRILINLACFNWYYIVSNKVSNLKDSVPQCRYIFFNLKPYLVVPPFVLKGNLKVIFMTPSVQKVLKK